MSLALTNRVDLLRDRAALFASARRFFAARGVLEVDVPILSFAGAIDTHIDLITAQCCGKRAYLHSSPEYGMKCLLSEGLGDIYQISHVFRDNEKGVRHTPEFTMVEWYRLGYTFQQMIDETIEFMSLFLNEASTSYELISYREIFLQHVGKYPTSLEEREALFGFDIEPHLGQEGFTVLVGFPPEQAALAQIGPDGFAERFEVFYKGIELANGYHELADATEQRHRMLDANQERAQLGKESYPLDETFLSALAEGFPDCCGVAVGFDRLMMLRHQVEDIRVISGGSIGPLMKGRL